MSAAEEFIRGLKSVPDKARTLHTQGRDFLARHLGSGPADDRGSRGFHRSVYKTIGEASSNPVLAGFAPAALLAGLENEAVGGITEKLGGRDFFGERGFDWQDLEANMEGLGQGLAPEKDRSAAEAFIRGLGRGPRSY